LAPIKELKHPVRAALIAWAAMSLLCLVVGPFTPFPVWAVVGGMAYSAFLALFAVGFALLPHSVSKALFWLLIAVATAFFLIQMILRFWVTPERLGVFMSALYVYGWILWVALASMVAASIVGWVRFFRRRHAVNGSA